MTARRAARDHRRDAMPRPIIVALAALFIGCSSAPTLPPVLGLDAAVIDVVDAAVIDVVDAARPDADADADAVTPPATTAGAQLAWVLSVLNGDPTALDADGLAQHFTPAFLRAVPSPTLLATFAQLAAQFAPLTLVGIEPGATDTALAADLVGSSGRYVRLRVATEAAAPGRMSGLFLQIAPALDPTLVDWSAFDARLAAVAPRARMLAAEITSGACVPVHGVEATTQGPLGSEFKLYVLSALAAQVAARTHAWDEPLAIRADWKSLPSGTWQSLSPGTTRTLQQFATQMISVSDNTAADHLLRFVGRDQVEAAVVASGHAMPALDAPFLTTRELFQLKLAVPAPDLAAYLAGDAARRRTYLDATLAGTTLDAALAAAPRWIAPVHIDDLEWFGSPADVCRVYARLRAQADAPGGSAIYDALSVNPGLPVDARVFPYVGFKGGSEPGVLTLSWLLRRADNRWRTFASLLGSWYPPGYGTSGGERAHVLSELFQNELLVRDHRWVLAREVQMEVQQRSGAGNGCPRCWSAACAEWRQRPGESHLPDLVSRLAALSDADRVPRMALFFAWAQPTVQRLAALEAVAARRDPADLRREALLLAARECIDRGDADGAMIRLERARALRTPANTPDPARELLTGINLLVAHGNHA